MSTKRLTSPAELVLLRELPTPVVEDDPLVPATMELLGDRN
jgi:hypothetical protein